MARKRQTKRATEQKRSIGSNKWLPAAIWVIPAAAALVARTAWLLSIAELRLQYATNATSVLEYQDAPDMAVNRSTTEPSTPRFWAFDDAAPKARRAVTHYLSSIPVENRIPNGLLNWTEYSANPRHTYPNKLHLFEMNPSVVILPKDFQVEVHGQTARYLASYRVTHWNNCFRSEIILRLFGTWENYFKKITQTSTDFLGLAVLDEDLQILADTVVTLQNPSLKKFSEYDDFRVFELRGRLYLTTRQSIFPLHLTFSDEPKVRNDTRKHWVPLQPAFAAERSSVFQPWLRPFPSCPVNSRNCKNLLYFVDGSNRSAVVYYPKKNPNHVKHVELDTMCGDQPATPYNESIADTTPEPSFHTFDEEVFPVANRTSRIFVEDRGSACCVSIRHPHTQQPLFLAVVHPKTVYPGKRLPQGVVPNIYLSRFIAFETRGPYRIVARTGMFCLGYPTADLDGRTTQHPLWNEKQGPLVFASGAFACPRIHFVTGMSEKFGDDSKILLSYGVSDCLPRIVELDKDEVVNMLFKGLIP